MPRLMLSNLASGSSLTFNNYCRVVITCLYPLLMNEQHIATPEDNVPSCISGPQLDINFFLAPPSIISYFC